MTEIDKDILSAVLSRHTKIVRMNLSNDSYEIVKATDVVPDDATFKLSVWFKRFLESDLISEEDKDSFEFFSNIDNIKRAFSDSDHYLSIHYRRKDNDGYRWCVMELIKAESWSQNNQVVMAFVRDVHNDYGHEYEYMESLEQINDYDSTTGLKSRSSYNRVIRQLISSNTPTGIIYCDINALKHVNDTLGHESGDMYLQEFAVILGRAVRRSDCYRISGDEFVAVLPNIDHMQLIIHAMSLKEAVKQTNWKWPIASVGYAYSFSGKELNKTIDNAEQAMYANKKAFYAVYPNLKR